MLDIDRFIRDILDCFGWPYVSPGGTGEDCSECGIDCSGLLIRALKLQGVKFPSGTHSSNYFARNELTGNPESLFSSSQLQVGMVVFKWREWTQDVSPQRWKADGKGDFHHVGVVTSTYPLIITHASSTKRKVAQDNSINAWTHCGTLKSLMPAGEPARPEGKMDNYKVVAENGKPVRFRKAASADAQVICAIPCGTEMPGEDQGNGWTKLMYLGTTGYMMSSFLEKTGSSMTIEERLEDHERRLRALEGGVG